MTKAYVVCRKFYLNNEYSANPEQAVQLAIKAITDAPEENPAKARRFVRFSAWLPIETKLMLLDKALQLVMNDPVRAPKQRCDTLRLIALHHPDVNMRRKLFNEAAKTAEEITDKDVKTETLLALAPYLEGERRNDVLQSVLNVAKKLSVSTMSLHEPVTYLLKEGESSRNDPRRISGPC